ncbi:metallophosphoesterase family protein [Paenibacillus doosanensis]|uniref:purple acid phosphatase family protein n=1 Tax=Paenibacillus doosanensis TaxID=1229154 RepID=UPI0021809324|nr:metallophosphoesterase family protein [Paenibacillus doosanensis]MCS7464093.1 metallophosphoesterase family protein [Paenibacillus doosanensis]
MPDKKSCLLWGLLIVCVAVFGGLELWKARGGSQGAAAGSPLEPKAIVTTFKTDAATSRAITWQTKDSQAASVVQWVKGGKADVTAVKGTTDTVRNGSGEKQGVHKANITGLEPDTEYTYRVGSGEAGGWSDPAVFRTAPADADEVTFLDVADSQGETEEDFAVWGQTLDKAFELFGDARFIVHNGDLTEQPEDAGAWDAFFGKAQAWLDRIPLMPVTGNHDEIDKNADAFVQHFNVPDNGAEGSIPGTTYSFDYGPVHIAVMNTESNVKAQAEWLRADLRGTNKEWLIVALHRGPYGGNQDEAIVKRWVPVFDEFGVDLVLQGHNHEYSRSYPLKGDAIVQPGEGTVYVVPNTAGPKLNKKKEDRFYHQVHFQNERQMFAGIRIQGDTLTYRAYDIDGRKLDEFELKHSGDKRRKPAE